MTAIKEGLRGVGGGVGVKNENGRVTSCKSVHIYLKDLMCILVS